MGANKKTSMQSILVIRSLKLRLHRVLVVFAALTVGAAMITAMAGVYFDINQKMSHELRNYGANFFVGPAEQDFISDNDYQTMLRLAPKDSLVATSPYLYGMAQSDLEKVVLMGTDFSQLKKLVPYWQVEGKWGGVSFDDRNAMIGYKLAEKLELKLGSTINILKSGKKHSLVIKGIIESGEAEDNYLIVNIPLVQQWLGKEKQNHYAMFSLANDKGQVDQYATILKQHFPNLNIRPIRKVSASEGKVLDKIKMLMGVVAFVILILSTLCVNTTLIAMVAERRYEFALQKALGASHRAITKQILTETMIITIGAILAGLLLGYLLAQVLGQSVFGTTIDLRLPVFFITATSSVFAALIAATVPTIKAINIDPAKVLKGE